MCWSNVAQTSNIFHALGWWSLIRESYGFWGNMSHLPNSELENVEPPPEQGYFFEGSQRPKRDGALTELCGQVV